MSKNITIQEGGVGKQMTVSKLKTNAAGSGTVTWIPEDEVSLGTKSITSNGTYKASDDGKYGYSQVTVNVTGGPGSANPDGTPSSGGGTPTGGTTGDDPIGDTPTGDVGSPAGGPGSCVVGTNPTTGNEVAVGVNSDGELVETPIPSSIEIVNGPTNTDYTDGSPIDLTGATVVAKNADGSTWTSEKYPDGIIPISELTIGTPTADINKTTGPTAGGFAVLDIYNSGVEACYQASPDKMQGPRQGMYHGIQVEVVKSGVGAGGRIFATNPSNGRTISDYSHFTYNDDTQIAFFAEDNSGTYSFSFAAVRKDGSTGGSIGSLSYLLGDVAVDSGGSQPVPIEWIRPADQKGLGTAFNITVTGSSSSGGTSF